MTKEELLPGCIEYFNGDILAANVWLDKYALKDKFGDIKESTPTDMHHRLAKAFARIEKNYPNPISEAEIFKLLDKFKYIVPQGSPMAGIGNDYSWTSLSNCFVIGNESVDSYGGIMRLDEEQIQLMKRRGGVGMDLSHLRSSGSMANNSALNDMAGSVLYAQRFSNSTKEVRQGDRRGALMLSMSVEHPDAEKFIDSKLVSGVITDANISVRITDRFMEAVFNNEDFIQTFPIGSVIFIPENFKKEMEYDKLVALEDLQKIDQPIYVKKIKAEKLWNKIIKNVHNCAEPGLLFWDTIIKESPADCYEEYKTLSTNPCGEIPLCADDSCRLMVMNLYSYVSDPFGREPIFDVFTFERDAEIAQRLMDDLVDLEAEKINKILNKINQDPEGIDIKMVEMRLWERILDKTLSGRRTGLGVTGEGDMLAAMGLRYGSDEAIKLSVAIHKTLALSSYWSSIKMAKERGCFSDWNYDQEKNNPFIQRILRARFSCDKDWYKKYGRRNISNLTISPAGTTSIMTQTTSGIEPCFNVYYKRRRRTVEKSKATFIDEQGEMFEEYNVFHHKFIEWYEKNWYKTSVELFNIDFKRPLENYTTQELDTLIQKSPYYKATSIDVDWKAKVEMQGAVQQWVDHSISATTNVPKDTPIEIIDTIYRTAYTSGCKGMTVYREGSRSGILISEEKEKFNYIDGIKRPRELECDIYHKTALKKDWMILVGKLENKPYEIFAFEDLPNHSFPTKIEKGRILKVKHGVYKLTGIDEFNKAYEIFNIIELIGHDDRVSTRKFSLMLRHHVDPKWIVKDIEEYSIVTSFDKVVQRVLNNYINIDGSKCPECGGMIINEGGCIKCQNCGWSKC